MRKIKICLLAFLLPILGYAQQDGGTEVLFVGNSFTYFWNMPQMVEAMARHQNVPLHTDQSTVGGSNLEQHWNSEKGTTTRNRLDTKKWDYVILQDHSLSTIEAKKRWEAYNQKFVSLVRTQGAQPVLFSSWAYKSNPLMQAKITESYRGLAKDLDVKLVPMGSVLALAREKRPDLDLFFDDKHLSPNGSYLEALVFYKFLTGKSVKAIPNRLTTLNEDGQKLYLIFIVPETGDFLRQLVEEFPMETLKASR
ncbi:hypothetical protein G3567_10540 [Psychroflexus sp. YR1-1]|uniref:DUF4886 domain-containing protein n=1 Tax=Psychroflexus aurantiacus TaxID=2709310 RepID=A0A6B3R4T7_9FLAO|nr:DUF4886 domain-containing protein [Psychroflexus aurantiacus]NEV94580.1 hypothetical protein [Psychroflexus aurantiacus]